MFDKITEYLLSHQWTDCDCGNYISQEEVIEYLKGAFIIDAFNEVRVTLSNGLIQNNEEFDKEEYDDSYNLASRIIGVVSEWFEEDKYI